MRVTSRMVVFSLVAGLLPSAAAFGVGRLLARRSGLGPPEVALVAIGLGLALLASILVLAYATGRRLDRQRAADGGAAPELEAADTPSQTLDKRIDLAGLAETLAAEQRRAPGPALRKLLQYVHPPEHHARLVSVNKAVEVCIGALQPLVPGGCRLTFDPDPNVGTARLDPDALHQLLLNLILNAREAAGASGQVDVRTQAMDGSVLIAVRDDGAGLGPDEIERIFEPFVTTKKRALGLGLTICRRIAAMHGGSIWATNVLPHGLEVGVTLPQ